MPTLISVLFQINNVQYSSTNSNRNESINTLFLQTYEMIFITFHSIALRLLTSLKAAVALSNNDSSSDSDEQDNMLYSSQQNNFLLEVAHGSHLWILSLCVNIADLLDTLLQNTLQSNICNCEIGNGLRELIAAPNLAVQLSSLCDSMLQHSWIHKATNEKRWNYSSKDIGVLVILHLKWAASPLDRVHYFVENQLSEVVNTDSNSGQLYPTLTSGM